MDKLDSTQIEQLRAIGAYLYEIRQDQARSLEEIAAKTYIPLRLLKALEAGQEQILPEPVFIQGFIRRYGDVLGLDGTALSQQFPIHQAVPTPSETNTREFADSPQPSPQPTAVLDPPRPRRRSRSTSSSRRPRPAFVPYLAAGAIGLLVLASLVFALRQLNSRSSQPTTAQQPTLPEDVPVSPSAVASPSPKTSASPSPAPSATIASPSAAAASPRVTPSPTKASPTPQSNTPVAVSINLTGDSWMEVRVDGELEYEGILKKGTQRTWTADQEVSIVAGNAGAVQIAANQEKAKAMGAAGQVEEMTFTAKGSRN